MLALMAGRNAGEVITVVKDSRVGSNLAAMSVGIDPLSTVASLSLGPVRILWTPVEYISRFAQAYRWLPRLWSNFSSYTRPTHSFRHHRLYLYFQPIIPTHPLARRGVGETAWPPIS
jgi:hypothetical protein